MFGEGPGKTEDGHAREAGGVSLDDGVDEVRGADGDAGDGIMGVDVRVGSLEAGEHGGDGGHDAVAGVGRGGGLDVG